MVGRLILKGRVEEPSRPIGVAARRASSGAFRVELTDEASACVALTIGVGKRVHDSTQDSILASLIGSLRGNMCAEWPNS